MTFTTGRQQITPRRGTDSYLVLFEQEGWDAPDDTGHWPSYRPGESDVDTEAGSHIRPYHFQPQVTNLGIVRQGTTIDASYFKGTPIHSKDGEGPATVTGDLTMQVSGNGTGAILRSMLQDRAPVATRLDDSGYTETDIVANIAIPSSSGTATVANNLANVPVPVRVTITLSDTPTVDSGETGTITITGTNRWGDSESIEFNWTAADITAGDLTRTTVMYFQSITSVGYNDHFAGGDFKVTFENPPTSPIVAATASLNSTSAAVTSTGPKNAGNFGSPTPQQVYVNLSSPDVDDTAVFAYIIFSGTDNAGRQITDRVRYQNTVADLARVKKTTAYFATVTSVALEGWEGGTFRADAVNQATNVIFTPSTALPVFWTLEVGKGNRPDTYRNVIPSSTSINFSREEPVRVVCSVMGGYAHVGQSVIGNSTPANRSKLDYTSEDVYSGWEANISIGNVDVAARSATFTVNHNLEDSDLLGGKYPSAPPSGAGEREVILTIELQTDNVNDFRDLYDSNASLHDVELLLRNVSHGAFPHQLQFEFPVVQITEDPDFVVADFGIVGQTLSLRAIYSEGLAYEFRILANYSLWYPVRTYAA